MSWVSREWRFCGRLWQVNGMPLPWPNCVTQETIAKALTGEWKEEHLFVLKQSLELYDFYTQQVAVCDAQIQRQYRAMKPRWDYLCDRTLPASKPQPKKRKNEPASDVRSEIM